MKAKSAPKRKLSDSPHRKIRSDSVEPDALAEPWNDGQEIVDVQVQRSDKPNYAKKYCALLTLLISKSLTIGAALISTGSLH